MTTVAFDIAALNPAFKAHAGRGIGRYVRELDRYFTRCETPDLSIARFSSYDLVRKHPLSRMIDRLPFGRTSLRQQGLAPFLLGKAGAQILHFPAHIDAPAWCCCPYIVTVLDLIPVVLEDLYKADKVSWRFHVARWLECRAIQNAIMVLAISEHTARDVSNILGVPRERIVVTPLGVDPVFFTASRPADEASFRLRLGLPLDTPLILYVGGIDQRKNMKALISAVASVREKRRNAQQKPAVLVIAGGVRNDAEFPGLRRLIEDAGMTSEVILTGYVEESDLLGLLAISSVFFFPSLYEGFGLPPLEAMASGLPVVSSNASSMPEVLENAAIMVDPRDYDGAATAICSILEVADLARGLAERGRKRAREFTWDRTGERTLEAYRISLGRVKR